MRIMTCASRFVGSWTWQLPFRATGPMETAAGRMATERHPELLRRPAVHGSVSHQHTQHGELHASRLSGARGSLPVDQRSLDRWFNIAAFTAPGPQQFGNAGRNILTGPGTAQADMSVFKDFFLSADQGTAAAFRAECFNVSNTPQFNNPAASYRHARGGIISAAGAPLTFQRTSREIQLALKLYF